MAVVLWLKRLRLRLYRFKFVIDRPYVWGCKISAIKLLTSEEVDLVLTTKTLFTMPVVDIRETQLMLPRLSGLE